MRPPVPRVATLCLLALLLATTPATAVDAGQVEIVMEVDEALEAAVDMTVRTTAIVEGDDSGTRWIKLPVPVPFEVTSFAPQGHESNGLWVVQNNTTTFGEAVFTWTSREPNIGTEISDVVLETTRPVPAHETITVLWFGYDIDTLDVRVDVPVTHEVVSGSRLTKQEHGVPAARSVWINHEFDEKALSLIIQPQGASEDPALSDPPWGGTGFVIVLIIGLISGAAWFYGKRWENRRKQGG